MVAEAELQLARLSKMGDSLEKINASIEWEIFRGPIQRRIRKPNSGKGGRPPWDEILMFKTVLLQDWNNLSDENTEYMINDRLTFQRFLGLTLGEKAPDEKTIWLFKEQIGREGMRELFETFNRRLQGIGMVKREGSLVDASFVDVMRQRNSRAENATIKAGEIPEEWTKENPKTLHKVSQKDTEALWAKKGNELHYGYKDHVKVDKDSKIIVDFSLTSANVHDVNEFEGLIDINDKEAWLDSAYASEEHVAAIMKKYPGIILHICEKGKRNAPLTE